MGLGRWRQKVCEFEDKLGYTERHYPVGREKKRSGKKVKKAGGRAGRKGREEKIISVFKYLV